MSYSETALIKVTFNGGNGQGPDGPGPVSVPGLKVGDVVLVIHHGPGTNDTSFFYPYVGTDDTLISTQVTDFTAVTFTAIVARLP